MVARSLILSFVASFLLAGTAMGMSAQTTLTVHVQERDGTPVEQAIVVAWSDETITRAIHLTKDDGEATLRPLAPALNYTVKVRCKRFLTQVEGISIEPGSNSLVVTVDLSSTARPEIVNVGR